MDYKQFDEQMLDLLYLSFNNQEFWIAIAFFIFMALAIISSFIPQKFKKLILISNIISVVLLISVMGLFLSYWLNVEEFPSAVRYKGTNLANTYSGFPFHFIDTYPTLKCYLCNNYVISIIGVIMNLLVYQILSFAIITGLSKFLQKRVMLIILLILLCLSFGVIYIFSRSHFVYLSLF